MSDDKLVFMEDSDMDDCIEPTDISSMFMDNDINLYQLEDAFVDDINSHQLKDTYNDNTEMYTGNVIYIEQYENIPFRNTIKFDTDIDELCGLLC